MVHLELCLSVKRLLMKVLLEMIKKFKAMVLIEIQILWVLPLVELQIIMLSQVIQPTMSRKNKTSLQDLVRRRFRQITKNT